MTAPEITKILKEKGITMTAAGIHYLAKTFSLFKEPTSLEKGRYSSLKFKEVIDIFTSPLLLTNITDSMGCSYNQLYYFILTNEIKTTTKYGKVMLSNYEDLARCHVLRKSKKQ